MSSGSFDRKLMSELCFAGVGAVALVAANGVWQLLRRAVFRPISDRETGEQRRRNVPPAVDVSAGYLGGTFEAEAARSKPVVNTRDFLTLRSGKNIFYQTWSPASGKVKGVVIYVHGYGIHCDLQISITAKAVCNMGEYGAIAFDLPGHGRSDGTLSLIPDWQAFVDEIREIVVEHLKPLAASKWGPVKTFGFGESMGGGALFTLLAREAELLDGVILVCPMLFVSRDLFPPWIVMQLFKKVLVPLLPLWPAAPNKDLAEWCNADPQMRKFFKEDQHHAKLANSAKPRLITAYELAFVSGDWMRARIPDFNVPTLIIHGGGDIVTDHRVSKELFERMRHPDKEIFEPAGVWHDDLFHGGPSMREGVKERYERVVGWLNRRC